MAADKHSEGGGSAAAHESFEARLRKLESLLAELERGELPLDEALKKYGDGVAELRRCFQMLGEAERKIEQLVEERDGGLSTAPFSPPPRAGESAADRPPF